jgi:tetratricopeptide (TPR) repeat protein
MRSFLGGLLAQTGAFDEARLLVASAHGALEELGLRAASVTYCISLLGDIELLAGDEQAAEGYLRECCDELERNRSLGELASTASELAEALLRLGRAEEAETWIEVAVRYAASDDVHAQMMWRPVRARILAAHGDVDEAMDLAREAAELSRSTDWSNGRAKVEADLGRVLLVAGRTDEAGAAFTGAVERYERKGNVVAATRLRDEVGRLIVA